MPTITATPFNTPAYVLVQADWTDVPDVTHASVTRTNTVTGEVVTLRPYISYDSGGFLALNCGIGLWWDTEPPLNVPLEYCTVAADTLTTLSSNPDFETTIVPWIAVQGTAVRSTAFAHSGIGSGLLTPTGTGTQVQFGNIDDWLFVAGRPITVEAWAMSPQGWNAVRLTTNLVYDNGISETLTSDPILLDDGEWRYIAFTFTPQLSGTGSSILFRVNGLVPATTLFYIDEFRAAQVLPVAGTACDTVTVTSDSVWLKNPLNPCLDVEIGLCDPQYNDCSEEETRVSYAGTAAEERPPNTVLSDPVNRIYPIPTNRQRRSVRTTLNLITHDCEARDAVIATNQPGDPLLFQAPATYCIPDRYISVGTLTETRLSVDQREDFRLMTLPYVVVERPAGPANAPCGVRIEDLCDIYTSWQSITLSGLDYEDLLLGMASHESPVNPLPPAARTWDDVEAGFVDWDAVEAGGTRDWDEVRDGL